jgi:hypothetical protein
VRASSWWDHLDAEAAAIDLSAAGLDDPAGAMNRQIGASVGTALIAVVLQHENSAALASATSAANGMFARVPPGEQKRIAGPLAGASGHTFVWAVAIAAVAILPALALLRAERTPRRASGTVDFKGIHAESAPRTPRAA